MKHITLSSETMKLYLYFDKKDFKWILLGKILKIFDSKKAHHELDKNGIKPLNKSINILKIVNIALFFSLDVSFVVDELKRNKKLKINN